MQATTVAIPYFDGHTRPMPLVLLRERATGMLAYFANYHNPATNPKHGNQDKWRTRAMNVEIALQKELYDRGIPRFVTGDMNDRDAFFCPFASQAPVIAARPGSYIGPEGPATPTTARGRLDPRCAQGVVQPLWRGPQPPRRADHRPPGADQRRHRGPGSAAPCLGDAYPSPILPATWH